MHLKPQNLYDIDACPKLNLVSTVKEVMCKHRNSYDRLRYDENLPEDLKASHFTPTIPSKFLIHGYGDTGTTGWVLRVKDEYLKKGKLRWF